MIELLYATGMRVSRARRRPRRRSASRRAVPDVHRQGQQGAARADRRAGEPTGCGATSATARPRAAQGARRRRALFLNARGGPLSRVGFWKILKQHGRRAGPAAHAQPARAAALVRDAPARARRRPARDPDDARPRRSVDDADLHARARGAAADASTIASTRGPDSDRLNCFPARYFRLGLHGLRRSAA